MECVFKLNADFIESRFRWIWILSMFLSFEFLVQILMRIWILKTVPFTNESRGSGSCSFRQWSSRFQLNIFFLSPTFMLISFWRYNYIIRHRKKIFKKSQTSRNQVFLSFFAYWRKNLDPESIQLNSNPDADLGVSSTHTGTLAPHVIYWSSMVRPYGIAYLSHWGGGDLHVFMVITTSLRGCLWVEGGNQSKYINNLRFLQT